MTAANQQQFVRIAQRADWMDDGACRGEDPNWWHPPRGGNTDTLKAKAICADCPVRDACLQWAIDNGERLGIWGGVSIAQHRRGRQSDDPTRRPVYVLGQIAHGTLAGYSAERRRGLPTCQACRDARNAARAQARREGRAA